MSDVRLSNASPTLERVDARPPDNVRPPVRRVLFGTPDREEIRRNVAQFFQDERQRVMETYDFDPVEGRPLTPRNFEWQEDPNAPEFYSRPPQDAPAADRSGQNAAERRLNGGQTDRSGARKRRSDTSDSCAEQSQSKRLHSDEDEDRSDGAGSQVLTVEEEEEEEEERSSKPESCVKAR
ncbi:cyclin-dependent kinase inhibitor 1Ba [Pholidichthys leucotaenia]